ncbi:MAG: acyltransferase domain-containing protein, partial [Deltaproteobacteria bacterium]|nr:acyltransferase domain-containing protein [Deltaproteobacteria bacterium]
MVFDESGREDRQWCNLGSVKSQIGHTKSAAGAAGLVKAVFALRHKVLPPTIKVDAPNPALEIEKSPFSLTTRARPWIRDGAHPRRAGVSSFGFGGSNFHIALEEYSGPADEPKRLRAMSTELVLLTGDSPAAVAEQAASLAKEAGEQGMLAYLARSTQEGFDASKFARLAVVAKDEADLAEKLGKAAEQVKKGEAFSTPSGIHFETGAPDGDVGFLFPGQGSQYIDMGAAVAMHNDDALAAWDAAARLDFAEDKKLHEVVFPRSAFDDEAKEAQADCLTATEWAQPAIGAASLALLEIVRKVGLTPAAVGGHSFGEVTALHAAGVLSADDMLRVARKRGELMRDAAQTPGSMTAVSAKVEDLRPLLGEWKLDVVVANHNSPKQVVLSGPTDAIDQVEAKLKEAGIGAKRLPVATAFHSHVVSPSVAPFKAFLDGVDFAAPNATVYSNAAAAPYPSDPAAIRAVLGEQVASSVRFVEQIEAMYAQGIRTFIEVGPGSVLTGLVGRILEGRPHRAINLDRRGRDGITSLHHGLGRLAVAGMPLQLASLWEDYPEAEDPRTTTKPKLVLKLNGTNYGKLYPPPG